MNYVNNMCRVNTLVLDWIDNWDIVTLCFITPIKEVCLNWQNFIGYRIQYPMTVILEMRRAHQHLTTYLFNSIYFERIAILIRLDGLPALRGFLNYLIFQSFDNEVTWFRKSVVHIKLGIYVFITITESIPLLVNYKFMRVSSTQ
jgi:hypothetical protein